MQHAAGLDGAELLEPTWKITGSKHEWMARIGSFVTGRALQSFNAELDALLFRGLSIVSSSVIDIESDHRAIIATFET
jgi:endonuclease/exonuclease/phosphatase (EEP) superfamily protein YafD